MCIRDRFITKVGGDEMGRQIIEFIDELGFDNSLIQIDKKFNTGEVNISLDKSKSANYIIKYPSAWDKIQLLDNYIEVVKNSDFFVFGSLVSRDIVSKETLLKLISHANFKVFDVNIPSIQTDLCISVLSSNLSAVPNAYFLGLSSYLPAIALPS